MKAEWMVEGTAETWVEATAAQLAVRSVVRMVGQWVGKKVALMADCWVAMMAPQMVAPKVVL